MSMCSFLKYFAMNLPNNDFYFNEIEKKPKLLISVLPHLFVIFIILDTSINTIISKKLSVLPKSLVILLLNLFFNFC
jgi:hypothetical protein